MAAKSWDEDYRGPAIRDSIRLVGGCDGDAVWEYTGSCCLPIAEKPVVGWTPGRIALVPLVLGFFLLGCGVLFGTQAERNNAVAGNGWLLVIATLCSLCGIAMFFLPALCFRQIVCLLIGDRGRRLAALASGRTMLTAEISSHETIKKICVSGDDYALILPEPENCRVLIEGISARYQIRAEDVERQHSFEFGNYIGTEIRYRISPQISLHIVLVRVSMLQELARQVPVLSFLRRFVRNPIHDQLVQVLQQPGSRS